MTGIKLVSVGFETEVFDGWEKFALMPRAPSNYRDPVKIKDYVEAAMEKQAQDAADGELTGRISKIAIIKDGNLRISEDIKDIPFPSRDYHLLAPRVDALFRLAAIELLAAGKGLEARKYLDYWDVEGPAFTDPFGYVFHYKVTEPTYIDLALKRVGIRMGKDLKIGSAEWWAVGALKLAEALGLNHDV